MYAKINSNAYLATSTDFRISANRTVEKPEQSLRAEIQRQDTASFDVNKAGERSALEDKFAFQHKNPYSVMDSYLRLANASSKAQVRAVMGSVQRNMNRFQQKANQGSTLERAQAQAAIASSKKLLLRGSRKIKQLDEETRSMLRAKNAENRQEVSRAKRMRQEANRLRSARFLSNSNIISEGMLSEMNNYVRFREYNYYEDKLAEITGSSASTTYVSQAPVYDAAALAVPAPPVAPIVII